MSGDSGVFETGLNLLTNLSTGGVGSYSNKGFDLNLKNGLLGGVGTSVVSGTKAVGEGIKEVTGANAAEEANNIARQQFQDQAAQANAARADAKAANFRNEVAASQGAGAARKSTIANKRSSSIVGDTSDFLGL